MAPRFSVLLPTHNRDDVIGFAIRSLLWQTETDFELLVVGDGCTDKTSEVVSQFDDPRIRWLDLPKAPLSGYANRNIALRMARGNLIAYAQHDDIFFPDHLARLVAALAERKAKWCYSRPLWIEPDGFIAPFAVDLTRSDELAAFRQRNLIPSSCVLHRASVFEAVDYWPEDVPQTADWVLWNRIIGDAGDVAYCREPTVLHFRAIWKMDLRYDNIVVERLAEMARESPWWPANCKVPMPPGRTPQQVIFGLMSSDPMSFCDALRTSVAEIYNRISWPDVFPAAPR
jgi:glycosyltransferase involved in cell wall biosynthesis